MAIIDHPSCNTRNWESPYIETGQSMQVQWIDLHDIDSPNHDLRHRGFKDGAARFARGEGMLYGNDAVYFASTDGDPSELGQIFKYIPSQKEGTPGEYQYPGKLELFVESINSSMIENADNLTVPPWGDLVDCEDSDQNQDLNGTTPKGEIYKLGRNAKPNSELTGATFLLGSTLFTNI